MPPGDTLTCSQCGSPHAAEHRFCGICGADLHAGAAVQEVAREPEPRPERSFAPPERVDTPVTPAPTPSPDYTYATHTDDAFPYYIPPTRVVVLTLLSSGLYIFYWMYVTWRQYREHTGEMAYPVMHALALLVPVYQFFRLHAHVRVYQELMQQRGVPTTLSPTRTVLIYCGVVVLGMISFMLPVESSISASQQAAYAAISIGQASLLAWIMWQAQTNLNRFWQHRLGMRLGPMPLGAAELALVTLGFLLGWGMMAMILLDPSFLATSGGPALDGSQ